MTVTQINKPYEQSKGRVSVQTIKDYVPSGWPSGVYWVERDSWTLQNDRWKSHHSSDLIEQYFTRLGTSTVALVSEF